MNRSVSALDLLGGEPGGPQARGELRRRRSARSATVRPVAAAISADGVGEGQQPRPGHLVDLARVAVLGERGDRDVGDVVDVDERLGHVAGGQGEHAVERSASSEEALAEVLGEQARRARSSTRRRTACTAASAGQRAVLAAARQQDERADAAPRRAARRSAPIASAAPGNARSGL